MGAGQFATDYDGSADFLSRGADLTGAADGKKGIFSCWFRIDGGDGSTRVFLGNTTNRLRVVFRNTNVVRAIGTDTVASTKLRMDSDTALLAGTTFHHVLCSWDLATTVSHAYLNDVEDQAAGAILLDANIEYTRPDWAIAALQDGTSLFNGALSEFYFSLEFLDFSIEANRRKFISAAGKPVLLGSDGSGPTGTAAIIYAPDGNAVVNQGTGGNFTKNGAPVRIAGPGQRPSPAALIYEGLM